MYKTVAVAARGEPGYVLRLLTSLELVCIITYYVIYTAKVDLLFQQQKVCVDNESMLIV